MSFPALVDLVTSVSGVSVVVITPMQPADLPEALCLWHSTEGVVMREVDAAEALRHYLERNPGLSFVARVEEQLIGAVLCGHDGRRGYLQHLAVAPEFRRIGVGHALADHCKAALLRVGIRKCHLFVLSDNHAARAFWSHLGWAQRPDVVLMSTTLSAESNA